MERVILDNNLGVAFSHELNAERGAPQDWDVHPDCPDCLHLDESSDVEDPEKKKQVHLDVEMAQMATTIQVFLRGSSLAMLALPVGWRQALKSHKSITEYVFVW